MNLRLEQQEEDEERTQRIASRKEESTGEEKTDEPADQTEM
jgi:hypothetical protein